MHSPDALPLLLARFEIEGVLTRYTRSLDRLDPEALKSCFHEDARVRMGGAELDGRSVAGVIMDLLRELELTHHQLGNVQLELAGDVAHVETYFTAIHRLGPRGWSPFPQAKPGEDLLMRGRYVDRFERRAGRWAIARRVVISDWARFEPASDRGLIAHSFEPRARRDRTDPVYAQGGAL